MKRSLVAIALAAVALLGIASPASAAHNGNNKAELTGPRGVTGTAIVNYSEGQGTFNATARVAGLPAGTYTFAVFNAANGSQTICTFTSDGTGTAGCSAQHLELEGFGVARIVDSSGAIVASGNFARRGNCRDANQAGSQCKANNTRQNA